MTRFKRWTTAICLLVSVSFTARLASADELSRCCAGGARHFRETGGSCAAPRVTGSAGVACTRTASICCLRALLDSACDAGAQLAVCPTRLDVLGGGLSKECCECCHLAKDLAHSTDSCMPPAGLSPACLRSFNKCCEQAGGEVAARDPHHHHHHNQGNRKKQQQHPSIHLVDSNSIFATPVDLSSEGDGGDSSTSDRCSSARCAHLCVDRGGERVECSCRAGYELAADEVSCIDVDECAGWVIASSGRPVPRNPCDPITERCVNTAGSYHCAPKTLATTTTMTTARQRQRPQQQQQQRPQQQQQQQRANQQKTRQQTATIPSRRISFTTSSTTTTASTPEAPGRMVRPPVPPTSSLAASFCALGFERTRSGCVDIDECLLLLDDCAESQRCLNLDGSFKCIRTLSCGTGYALDSSTEQCLDVDECNLGTHDCGVLYVCRNTQGSYRCDPIRCGDGEVQNPQTGECTPVHCPPGYKAQAGECVDVDECESINGTSLAKCAAHEDCVNTAGSFRCERRGELCATGFEPDPQSGFCVDTDECSSVAGNPCGSLPCVNTQGAYRCICSSGFDYNMTPGSFECRCASGFRLASDRRTCDDIDECLEGVANCQQRCVNTPGSFQCICDRGYEQSPDGSCRDIDECSQWAGQAGGQLCMGACINTPGAYRCECPTGYRVEEDGRTCSDVDECTLGACQGHDRICVNTLGSHKCHDINCPAGYLHDTAHKNRCIRSAEACELSASTSPEECDELPLHYSWQFLAIPKYVALSSHRPSIALFTIKGPASKNATVQFELDLMEAVPEQGGVLTAVRTNFLLQKGEERNSAVVALRDPLDGPQVVRLRLVLRLSRGKVVNEYLQRSNNVEDGYTCVRTCANDDATCRTNVTKELLYQFRALPSIAAPLTKPREVSRIRALLGTPYIVEYRLDARNEGVFGVRQIGNIGVVEVRRPVRGPATHLIRLHILTRTLHGALMAHNYAHIEVHVSANYF